MDIHELKALLLDLVEKEPEFMNRLVGEVVRSNLCIDSAGDGDYYNPSKTYVLQWKTDDYGYREFSKVY